MTICNMWLYKERDTWLCVCGLTEKQTDRYCPFSQEIEGKVSYFQFTFKFLTTKTTTKKGYVFGKRKIGRGEERGREEKTEGEGKRREEGTEREAEK